jgi:hypothetical protein
MDRTFARGAAALALVTALAAAGCNTTGTGDGGGKTRSEEPAKTPAPAGAPFYAEEWDGQNGRFYVFGKEKTHSEWKKSKHLATSKTYIGEGPNDCTVVFEEDTKDEPLRKRIQETFSVKYGVDLRR